MSGARHGAEPEAVDAGLEAAVEHIEAVTSTSGAWQVGATAFVGGVDVEVDVQPAGGRGGASAASAGSMPRSSSAADDQPAKGAPPAVGQPTPLEASAA